MTAETNTCMHHETNSMRIASMEALSKVLDERTENHSEQISDIYDKWNDMTAIHAQIMGKLGSMESKQDTMLTKIVGLCTQFTKHVDEEEDRDEKVKEALDEINRFAWFRNRMNSLRDNLPGIFLTGILIVILILVLAHELDLSSWIKSMLKGH